MASTLDLYNIDTDAAQLYQQYSPPVVDESITNITGSSTTVINTINGNSGSVVGPSITISGGVTGYDFNASGGNTLSLVVASSATVRASISAAESGTNSDINSFTALTGNTGVSPWTGVADGSSQSTYPATTASAVYTQSEIQGLMDKMQEVTEFMMFLVAALLAPGVVET